MKQLFVINPDVNGRGNVFVSWQRSGNFLATAGANRRVHIFDRQGKIYHQVPLQGSGEILAIEWDKDGEVLAILQSNSSIVFLLHFHNKKLENLETNVKDLSFIRWSGTGHQLAIGNAKGTLLLFNRKTMKLIPVKGKHGAKITCGCWNTEDNLALGGQDKIITISNIHGDTIDQQATIDEPHDITFNSVKQNNVSKDNTICANMSGKCLWMYTMGSNSEPLLVNFHQRYGTIKSYLWFGDGYIMVGFTTGYVAVISTHKDEIGKEINSCKFHQEMLCDIAFCPTLQKGATIGDSCVKVFDMSSLNNFDDKNSDKIELDGEFGSLTNLEWTLDGQILTVCSENGYIYSFLTSLPVMHETYGGSVLYLTSLRELCVRDVIADTVVSKITIDVEPTFVSLGQNHVAVGMNNRAWFYKIVNGGAEFLEDREYLSTVDCIKISHNYAAIVSEGKVILTKLEKDNDPQDKIEKYLPEKDDGSTINSVALTSNFLIYSTSRGNIVYFSLEDWKVVNDFRFEVGVKSIFPNFLGTRVVFIDETHAAYLYSPIDDRVLPIEKFTASANNVLWDLSDSNLFVVSDNKHITTYVYILTSMSGPHIQAVRQINNSELCCKTEKPEGFTPLLLHGGKVTCQKQSGALETLILTSHDAIVQMKNTAEHHQKSFHQFLNLNRISEALNSALYLKNNGLLETLATKALNNIELEVAVKIYQSMGNAAMAMAIESLLEIDEINVIVGTIAMLNKDFSEAESKFMQSSQRMKALEMRRDLMHWDRALQLAETLDPTQIPFISREYAQQLELKGEFSKSFELYQKSLGENSKDPRHVELCTEGIARVTIRLGDLRKGLAIALRSNNKKLCRECAQLFEEYKQLNDAAQLYVKADMYEKAAEIYVNAKNFKEVGALMSKVKSPKLHVAYAKAKEVEGKYEEAVKAYEMGGDANSVVRIYLTKLNNPAKAIQLVKNSKSNEGALLIATFCMEKGNYKRAVEFLMMGDQFEKAFELASQNEEMDTFSLCLGDRGSKEDFLKIARHFESKGEFEKAGDFYTKGEDFEKSLKLYLQLGEQMVGKAIDVVGISKNDSLTHQLVKFLMGDLDGVPKDPKYIFQLYTALGNYSEAAKTASIIAKKEQDIGNYSAAHDILFDTHQQLMKKSIHVPLELQRNLMLLHSYLVIKDLTKMGEGQTAARMLIRVARNISKFPNHVVQILTTTVLQCFKAGLKKSAFEYASVLVRPEYRQSIHENYKKTVLQIVRHKKGEPTDPDEEMSPCPYCEELLGDTELDCNSCKNFLPYCIATGQHMTLKEFTVCPSCHFPALYGKFLRMLQTNNSQCPMCHANINATDVSLVPDPKLCLKQWQQPADMKSVPS